MITEDRREKDRISLNEATEIPANSKRGVCRDLDIRRISLHEKEVITSCKHGYDFFPL